MLAEQRKEGIDARGRGNSFHSWMFIRIILRTHKKIYTSILRDNSSICTLVV